MALRRVQRGEPLRIGQINQYAELLGQMAGGGKLFRANRTTGYQMDRDLNPLFPFELMARDAQSSTGESIKGMPLAKSKDLIAFLHPGSVTFIGLDGAASQVFPVIKDPKYAPTDSPGGGNEDGAAVNTWPRPGIQIELDTVYGIHLFAKLERVTMQIGRDRTIQVSVKKWCRDRTPFIGTEDEMDSSASDDEDIIRTFIPLFRPIKDSAIEGNVYVENLHESDLILLDIPLEGGSSSSSASSSSSSSSSSNGGVSFSSSSSSSSKSEGSEAASFSSSSSSSSSAGPYIDPTLVSVPARDPNLLADCIYRDLKGFNFPPSDNRPHMAYVIIFNPGEPCDWVHFSTFSFKETKKGKLWEGYVGIDANGKWDCIFHIDHFTDPEHTGVHRYKNFKVGYRAKKQNIAVDTLIVDQAPPESSSSSSSEASSSSSSEEKYYFRFVPNKITVDSQFQKVQGYIRTDSPYGWEIPEDFAAQSPSGKWVSISPLTGKDHENFEVTFQKNEEGTTRDNLVTGYALTSRGTWMQEATDTLDVIQTPEASSSSSEASSSSPSSSSVSSSSEEKYYFRFVPDEITVDSQFQKVQGYIRTNSPYGWKIPKDFAAEFPSGKWVSISPLTGKDNENFEVTFQKNEEGTTRNHLVMGYALTSRGTLMLETRNTLYVTQTPEASSSSSSEASSSSPSSSSSSSGSSSSSQADWFEVFPTTMAFDADGKPKDSNKVRLRGTVGWQADTQQDWCSMSPSSGPAPGDAGTEAVITCQPNKEVNIRSTLVEISVTLNGSPQRYYVNVIQDGTVPSPESESSSSSEASSGASSASSSKTAILPVRGKFLGMMCMESPETWFIDFATIHLPLGLMLVDQTFIDVTEPGSIAVVSAIDDRGRPARAWLRLEGREKKYLTLYARPQGLGRIFRPDRITVQLIGRRLGHRSRFPEFSEAQFRANEAFYAQAHRGEPPEE